MNVAVMLLGTAPLLMAALGVGFLLGAPVLRILLDRVQARHAMAASLAVTAAGYVGLFSSTTIAAALPAGVVIGMTGAVILSVPVATVQRVTGNEVLGRERRPARACGCS